MLRSLYSGISGLRSHQTMLDVTGNNIANVNTTAFKASATQFQDTLSQLTQGAGGPQAEQGGTNPAQVGLGVRVAGISTNFAQGSAQATGKSTDMMISGDGFFVTRVGNDMLYTRAGSFDLDAQGRLVTPDGGIVQGWSAVDGTIMDGGAIGNITLPLDAISPAVTTSEATFGGNLPSDAADGTQLVRDTQVFDANGQATNVTFTFTRNGANWDVSYDNAGVDTALGSLTFVNGALTTPGNFTLAAPAIDVDMTSLTGFAGMTTVAVASQDGRRAGTLDSFTMASDGTLIGSFSNGASEAIGRIALANFTNPGGLEKAGNSTYRATFNSGNAELGTPGQGGLGTVTAGALEMSNVDLSQEFTNLIVAQRGFQANARIITTSDEVLQELTNLKR
ncbi:flagellar hook protein FlgE [Salinibacterium hongtaonis]|uniref:Flagellar hook protein FlgE n=1 Tax=Homoserinimonas hongtaonis TaxID=2079791 RepID=A0A2U1T223_9MICO|nr:flagellar hook protein FlgE [Salinibacterium hongtaonis]AWB90383.1 flagellar hook protein [Salinibacterium hongtaonis]PWB97823.1 flagellar hook protein FlgE [Salinibacterium hongtaonis]